MDRLTEYLEETIEAIDSDQAAAYDVEYSVSRVDSNERARWECTQSQTDQGTRLPCAESRES